MVERDPMHEGAERPGSACTGARTPAHRPARWVDGVVEVCEVEIVGHCTASANMIRRSRTSESAGEFTIQEERASQLRCGARWCAGPRKRAQAAEHRVVSPACPQVGGGSGEHEGWRRATTCMTAALPFRPPARDSQVETYVPPKREPPKLRSLPPF
jgi:hypothetical protein